MKRHYLFALLPAAFLAGVAYAQYPIVDMVANNVVQKYQMATCEQLWAEKGQPKTPQQQEQLQMLRSNPQIRTYFIDKIAGPVVNKMFECGMLP
jgi:hypothetical protein